MPGGISLGGAYFELSASSAGLIQALQQAEAQSKKSVAAISAITGIAEKDVARYGAAAIKAHQQAADAAGKSETSFGGLLKSGVALGAGLAGVQLGIEGVRGALEAISESTSKAEQSTRALTAAYGGVAGAFKDAADKQAAAVGRVSSEVEQGAAAFGILQKQYGVTTTETEKLIKVALDLNAAYGGDLLQTFRDVSNAIQGEPQALEKYGIALQQNAIVNSKLLTDQEKKLYESMDGVSQSRIRLRVLMEGAKDVEGQAAQRSKDQQGAFDNLKRSTDELAKALGSELNPKLETGAGILARMAEAAGKVAKGYHEVAEAQRELQAKGINEDNFIGDPGTGQLIPRQGAIEAQIDEDRRGPANTRGQDAREAFEQKRAKDQQVRRDQETAARDAFRLADRKRREEEAKDGIQTAELIHDREVKALEEKRGLAESEREIRLRALDEETKGALAAIETQSRASKEASDAEIAHLHVLETAAKQAASDRHADEVSGIDASQKAAEDAVGENIRNLEIERDASKQASEDKRDSAIRALDDEKTARDKARTDEDRALQDSTTAATRLEDGRHQGVLRGLDDEVKALNDKKDADLRALDEVGKKQADQHQARTRALSDEADADKARHDQAVRAIDDEAKHDSDAHDAKLRSLSDEADADRAAADAAARIRDAAYEAANRQRDAAHEAAQRDLDAEADADRAAAETASRARDAAYEQETRQRDALHESAVRGFEAEADAARDAAEQVSRAREATHDQVLAEIDQEADAAHAAHDRAVADIDRQKDVEDDRHRAAMSAIDAEERRRQDAVDAQIAALDALDKADQDARQDTQLENNVTNARFGLLRAESTGNQSEIVRAQQELADALAAISHTQVQRERDVQRDLLKSQKDRIAEEEDARRDAENELNRQHQREIQAAKDTADATLKAVLDALAGRKQAENTSYARIVQDSKDALDRQLADIARRKLAEADAYALAKQQAADAHAAATQAAADALAKQLADVEKRKQAEADAYAAARQSAEDAYKAAKQAADDALARQLDDIARRTRAEDDAYKAGQDRRAREKTDLDDALAKQLDRVKKEKDAEDAAYDNAKDKLDKRKIAVGDANKDELDKIAARKLAENDAHDNAVIKAQDQATAEKRAVQDRRDAEDLADKNRRIQIQDAYTNEERDRHARYDDEATGEIPALHRALDAAQNHFRERKTAADLAYQTETRQIDETYNNAEHGLIPLAQKAATEVATGFRDQATNVNASAASQKAAINDEYSNPGKTGLLDLIEQAKQDTDHKLIDQRKYWDDWKEDLSGPEGKIPKVIGKFDELIKKITEAGGTVASATENPSNPGGRQGGPGGDAYHGIDSYPGGAGSSAEVPAPYRVTFPFDAPYNGPYAGGAAWEGGPSRHRGVDLALPGADNGRGTPYEAFQPGTIHALIPESSDPAGGNGVIVRTDGGLYNYYGHNDRFLKGVGERVGPGAGDIATLGRSGLEDGMQTHLHYEVRRGINGDPVGSTIDPVPYMGGGGTTGGGRVFEFDLFGRHFRFRLPGGTSGMELIQAIEQLGEQMGGRDFGRAGAAIALSEGADGDLTHPGAGGARGPYQFDPGGELPAYAAYLGRSIESAGDYAGTHPLDAASWALRGYLGDALRSGLAQDPPLKGAQLAEWGSFYGQKPADDENGRSLAYRAGEASVRLYGYANGGIIPEPTVLVGRTLGPYAMAGETGRPEWVTPNAPGQNGAPVNRYTVPIQLANHTMETLVFEGATLLIRRGDFQDFRA